MYKNFLIAIILLAVVIGSLIYFSPQPSEEASQVASSLENPTGEPSTEDQEAQMPSESTHTEAESHQMIEEARKMAAAAQQEADALIAQVKAEKQRRIDELNQIIEKEVEARKLAESAAADLRSRIDEFNEQLVESRAHLQRLEKMESDALTARSQEVQAALDRIDAQKAEIDRLKDEKAALEAHQAVALQREKAVRDELIAQSADLSNPEASLKVRSHNYRPRRHVLFNEHVLERKNPEVSR